MGGAGKSDERTMIDGEGFGHWRAEFLPAWLLRRLAPFTAEARAQMLDELYFAMRAAAPNHPNPSEPTP